MRVAVATDIAEYLRKRGYADHVVRGGLAGLVKTWESVAEGLTRSNPAYIMYEEFLNDVDGRRILRECMELVEARELAQISRRVAEADHRFKEGTVAISPCVWGDANAVTRGYTPDIDWCYYRRPKVIDESWPEELRDEAA